MSILITLCARGGSKGIPGKNIKLLNTIPTIAYSINHAKKFANKFNADIAISTDDEAIKAIASGYGIETEYIRPADISQDNTGKVETISHLLQYEESTRNKRYDFILDLDVSSPLRTFDDLSEAFSIIQSDENALTLFSVNRANRNPYFNMVEANGDGYYSLVKQGSFLTRQLSPQVYDMNASFYYYRRIFFDLGKTSVITDRSLIYVMQHICFDLDHVTDFDYMEYLIINNKLGFDL